ncbi:ABC transporter permease [Microbacterium thalassium]|uniref:ABC-2 type transport system permease protein n=1 Tax=Microbacterium thalassium TaxID=362649 RepID=A0A7X0FTH1_9MICO|nr:ABC transporter permease [Microbacterium thalassium]MBB6392890.1 ABC-2 type transport system permease protein [Microbacterium thalassium]GLK22879.1 transport permease protein [Microbacterium thalassium]
MSTQTATTRARSAAGRSTFGMGLWRARFELMQYFRSGDTVVFTFLFPILMLGLFSVAFGADGDMQPGPGLPPVPVAQMYLPAMLAAGLLLSGLQNLAIDIAVERSEGMLKRLGSTPLSPVSYFIGKILQVAVTGVLQAAAIIVFAVLVFQVPLPTEPDKWLTFAWVFLLGITSSALLGVALSTVPRSSRSAAAVVIPIVLIVQFISGVYLFFYMLPEWLQNVAGVLPVKWMAQGMRYVFLPDEYSALEQNGEWNLAGVAIALAIWLVVGLVLARVTFRWNRRDA